MREEHGTSEHEQNLYQLLEAIGRTLVRRERLFEEIEGRHAHVRNFWVQEGADRPPEALDENALAEELRWELERKREQELELHRILDILKHQSDLENQALDELEPRLVSEHRDGLYQTLKECFERRESTLDGIELASFEEKRDRIREAMEIMRELEDALSRVMERHLVRLHQQ